MALSVSLPNIADVAAQMLHLKHFFIKSLFAIDLNVDNKKEFQAYARNSS